MSAPSLLVYAVGDVALQRKDPGTAFAKVAPVLRQADLVFGNLESPISDRGAQAYGKDVSLCSRADTLPAIVSAGFNVMSVANNHIMDYGVEAMQECLQLLRKNGIAHVGAGLNVMEARQPVVLERKGVRIAFLAYNSFYSGMWVITAASNLRPGAAPVYTHSELEPPHVYRPHLEAMKEDIAGARARADLVMVSCHWGLAWTHAVVDYQRAIGRAAIDTGADIVLGHHPHILQGIEVYKGKAICYSLSEFCFELPFTLVLEPQSILLKIEVGAGKIQRVSFRPVLMDAERTPEVLGLGDPAGREIADLMEGLCRELGTKVAREGDEVVVFADGASLG